MRAMAVCVSRRWYTPGRRAVGKMGETRRTQQRGMDYEKMEIDVGRLGVASIEQKWQERTNDRGKKLASMDFH